MRPAERLALVYLAAHTADERPSLAELQAQLEHVEERQELASLVATALRAVRSFPLVLRAGQVLAERYQLIEEIGSGGTGRVWSALDRELQRQVAVKVLEGISNEEAIERLARERQALVRVKHPGIVALHDVGRHDSGTGFLVIELVAGVPLERVLQALRETSANPPTAADLARVLGLAELPGRPALIDPRSFHRSVARIMIELLQALEAAHAEGIVHRDLKPSNVLLRPGGHPAILDFGLAALRSRSEGPVTRGLHGSLGYVAPEQLRNARTGLDPRTDIYQAGLLLYALLTRRDAFPRDGEPATFERIRAGALVPPRVVAPDVPHELSAICCRAVAADPEARYRTAREFREDLARYLERRRLPMACADAPWSLRLRYLARSHALQLGAAGLLAALLVFAGMRMTERVLIAGAEVRDAHTIDVFVPDGRTPVLAFLEIEREGTQKRVIPLDDAAPTAGAQRVFTLRTNVDAAVLRGLAGRLVLVCYFADEHPKLAHLAAMRDRLARFMVEGTEPRGATSADWRMLLEYEQNQGKRGGGASSVQFPEGFGPAQILGDAPIQTPGCGMVRVPLTPLH